MSYENNGYSFVKSSEDANLLVLNDYVHRKKVTTRGTDSARMVKLLVKLYKIERNLPKSLLLKSYLLKSSLRKFDFAQKALLKIPFTVLALYLRGTTTDKLIDYVIEDVWQLLKALDQVFQV